MQKQRRGLPGTVVTLAALAAFAMTTLPFDAQAGGRDRIRVVGSATVFPLALASAEAFNVKTGHKTPLVEANGSAEGFRLFCAGLGVEHPDIATAERPIAAREAAACRQKGIKLAEIKFGYQGVVLAKSRRGAALNLTPQQVFLALAGRAPGGGGNPYKLWSDIDFALPVKPIEVLGPPLTSPLRDAFIELVMAPAGAGSAGTSGDAARLRDDGIFVQVATEDAQILDRLERNPDALGIFGFIFQQENAARLQAVAINGVTPSITTIADGSYAPARPLYLYVKRQQLGTIPGLRDYVAELTGEAAAGAGGYLVRRGLIPLPAAERAAQTEAAAGLMSAGN